MKELFQVKKTVIHLPDNWMSRKLVIFFLFSLIPFLLIFIDAFIQLAEGALKSAQNPQNVDVFSFYIKYIVLAIAMIIFASIAYIVIIVILSWVIKKFLLLFKKSITLYKMLNIFLYVLLIHNFLRLIIILPIYLEKRIFSSIFEDASNIIIDNMILVLYIFCFILYIYAIKISISPVLNSKGKNK